MFRERLSCSGLEKGPYGFWLDGRRGIFFSERDRGEVDPFGGSIVGDPRILQVAGEQKAVFVHAQAHPVKRGYGAVYHGFGLGVQFIERLGRMAFLVFA